MRLAVPRRASSRPRQLPAGPRRGRVRYQPFPVFPPYLLDTVTQ
jgi:hypothetical protein